MSEIPSECQLVRYGDTVILAPTHALGEMNYPQFEIDTRGALGLLREKKVNSVIVDLHQANLLGSNTINLFLRMHQQVEANGGRMVLCRVSPFVREMLGIMHLHKLWPIGSSPEQAMEIVNQRGTRILVVDDCYTERCLIAGLLNKEPTFEMQYAEDGFEALKLLKQTIPDLVLTDLIMPRMDGLELLDSIRRNYPQTPVILMTAYGNQSLAARALQRGAVSYVSKANRANRLVNTIKRIIRGVTTYKRSDLGVINGEIQATFRVENDREQVCRLVDLIQQLISNISSADPIEQLRVGVAVEEAMLNALYHGNLEISSEQWEQVDQDLDELDALAERLRHKERLRNRFVSVDVKIAKEAASFIVRDQGTGFDTRAFSQSDSRDCFELGQRRGSMLMSQFMDVVSFNDRGNEITLVKSAKD